MDATVGDELLQGQLGDLPADVVEAADDYNPRRVVDDDIDAGGLFKGPDVPAFAADDPAFHVVAGDVDARDGRLGGMLGGKALDGNGDDLARLLLADFAERRLVLLNPLADLLLQLVFEAMEEELARLRGAQAGEPLKHVALLAQQRG